MRQPMFDGMHKTVDEIAARVRIPSALARPVETHRERQTEMVGFEREIVDLTASKRAAGERGAGMFDHQITIAETKRIAKLREIAPLLDQISQGRIAYADEMRRALEPTRRDAAAGALAALNLLDQHLETLTACRREVDRAAAVVSSGLPIPRAGLGALRAELTKIANR